jgi:hypothetical protein
MFEKHKAEKAAKEYREALAHWQTLRDGYAHLLELAQQFQGEATDEVMLKSGEALFYKVTNTSLIEERRAPGHYTGGSTGFSIPVATVGGHAVRYHIGATRGTYVQGAPIMTGVDTGTTYITNQRVIFEGGKQTRECLFAKLIGVTHDDSGGETTISVSNRQKPTTIHYGPGLAGNFDFRLELALAHYKGTVDEFVNQVRSELGQIEAAAPQAPATLPAS